MADRRTVITLSVQDDFSRQLQNFARQMSEAERGVQNMGRTAQSGGGLKAFNEQLFFMSQNGMLVYNTFSRIFSTLDQWSQLGFGVTKSYMALDKLTGSAEESKAWIDAITGSLNNTVTSSEAASQAYQLMRFNMADTAEEAGQFARDIAIVAQANAQLHGDVGAALQQVQLTIANQSTMRLDQLGLSVASVTERVKELQAATPGLSKELAFQQAVMDGLHDEANMLGDDFLAVGSKTAQLKTHLRELKDQLYVTTSEGVEGLASAALDLITILGELGAKETVVRIVYEIGGQQAGAGTESWLDLMLAGPLMAARELGIYGQPPQPEDLDVYGKNLPPAVSQSGNGYWISSADDKWIFVPTFNAIPPSVIPTFPPMGPYEYDPTLYPAGAYGSPITQARQQYAYSPGQIGLPPAGAHVPPSSYEGGMGWTEAIPEIEEAYQKSKDLASVWATDIAGAVQDVAGLLTEGVSTTSDMVTNARDVASEFERLQNISLSEVLGIDASRFASDVGGEMAQALRDAGVEGDAAAAAIERYNLATGLATGASEIFDNRMKTLADDLATGRISVTEYVNKVMELSTTDFSWINDIVSGLITEGDIERANRYIEAFSKGPQYVFGAPITEKPTGENLWPGGEMPHVLGKPTPEMAPTSIEAQYAVAERFWEDLAQPHPMNVDTTEANAAVGDFQNFVEGVVGAKYRLGVEIYATNATLNVPINVVATTPSSTPPSSGGGQYTIPEYASGGYTGDNGDPFMALLHRREYIIPEDRLRADGGAGGTQRVVVENHLYMDSREIAVAQSQQNRLRNTPNDH